MIRINLLGGPRPKKGKRAAAAMGEGVNPLLVAAVVAVITLGVNFGWYMMLNREAASLAVEIQKADEERRRLNEVKLRFEEAERTREHYRVRYEIIDRLRSAQAGPVNLLTMIGDTVNATDAVWLNTMKEEGSQINIEGVALSVHAVANLMRNLKNTGYFESVEMKESYQDERVTDMKSFVFTLACEKRRTTT
jgi:Tfp pilus assembly protein PilN